MACRLYLLLLAALIDRQQGALPTPESSSACLDGEGEVDGLALQSR